MRVRLLPLVIAVAVITLGFRLEALREGVTAVAQEAPPTAAPIDPFPSANEPAAESSEASADGLPAADAEGAAQVETSTLLSALPTDPFALTDSEIELLQALSERRAELDRREAEFETREALLTAAETRIEQKIAELEELQATIEELLVQHDEQEQAQLDSLVKIYETMKPKDAARIFEELEMAVLLDVVENMKERRTAPILAEMNPAKAKAVTIELAQRRELPLPRE